METASVAENIYNLSGKVALITGAGGEHGIGRAIVPAHSPSDGDLVFSVSTGERPMAMPERDLALIGHAAALCLARAIARAIYLATPADGDLLPTWSSIPGNR